MSQWSHQCHQCHQCHQYGSRLSSLAVFMHSIALLSVLIAFCAVQYAFGEARVVELSRRTRFKDDVLRIHAACMASHPKRRYMCCVPAMGRQSSHWSISLGQKGNANAVRVPICHPWIC